MKPALIFDMDGTLFQTNTILELSLDDTFSHLKALHLWSSHTPVEKYRDIMGVPLPVVWKTLLPNHSEETRAAANAFFHERLIKNIEAGNGALYPNVEALFHHLTSKGYPVFIASNGMPAYLKAIVKFINWTAGLQKLSALTKFLQWIKATWSER